jgi:gamma-glutamyltranspeptidase/glutathione hydrolase/leukotriene-C4 hydrolase
MIEAVGKDPIFHLLACPSSRWTVGSVPTTSGRYSSPGGLEKKMDSDQISWTWAMAGFVVTTIVLAITLGYGTSMQNGESHGEFRHERKRVVEVDFAVVAADEERCSAIGRDSLRLGGNAVDATVATALCLGVVNPMASGIGGGAFLLLRLANGSSEIYDMRETAPAAASMDMYESDPDSKLKGALSVGVPGELAGLYMAWKRHGRLPWETLVLPAVYLAANGFVVQPYLAHHIQLAADDILADKGLADIFAPNGKLLSVGDICLWKNLSQTLKEVAKHGPSALYNGAIGENLITDVRAAGGILTVQDLQHYTVQIRQPIVTETMGFTLLGMPPPSSGGACIALVHHSDFPSPDLVSN